MSKENIDLRKRIFDLYKTIDKQIETFVFDPELCQKMEELGRLRKELLALHQKCDHKFDKGYCIYCLQSEN